MTTEKGNLKRHQQAVHEGKKYSCDKCGYQATSQGSLKRHREAKHEGVTYSCDDCNYKAAFKAGLVQHIRVKHEGIRYTCDRCDYEATQSGNLKAHKEYDYELGAGSGRPLSSSCSCTLLFRQKLSGLAKVEYLFTLRKVQEIL